MVAQQPDSTALALINVTIIDGTGAAPMPGMTLIIQSGRIADLHPTGARELPADAAVHDLSGKALIPGLIEAHTHLRSFYESRDRLLAELERMLYSGVVAVREMAGDSRVSAELDRSARLGHIASPDIYFSAVMMGPHFRSMDVLSAAITQGDPGDVSWIQTVTAETDLRLAVARAAGSGATALKLYIEMEPERVAAITREAHRQGLRVWAHPAVFPSRPLEVVQAGVDGISHACGVAWQDADLDTRRFARVSRENRPIFDPALIEDNSTEMTALFEEMVRRGTFFDATFSMYHGSTPVPFGCAPELMTAITRAAHSAGVVFLTGTDWHAPPEADYPSLHQEIIALVEHGILSPLEALAAATRNGAVALNIGDRTGTIEIGKSADLVILDANPVEDIHAIRNVHATAKRGVLFPRSVYEQRRAVGQTH
jgi:imidazolonepropionase-like amidohydrolase